MHGAMQLLLTCWRHEHLVQQRLDNCRHGVRHGMGEDELQHTTPQTAAPHSATVSENTRNMDSRQFQPLHHANPFHVHAPFAQSISKRSTQHNRQQQCTAAELNTNRLQFRPLTVCHDV
jgi:hypothetical protein